jgi:hypothetical protein
VLAGYQPLAGEHAYWSGEEPQAMLIDEVEAIWSAIAERDDWQPLQSKVAALRAMGDALGEPPRPAGHARRARHTSAVEKGRHLRVYFA